MVPRERGHQEQLLKDGIQCRSPEGRSLLGGRLEVLRTPTPLQDKESAPREQPPFLPSLPPSVVSWRLGGPSEL